MLLYQALFWVIIELWLICAANIDVPRNSRSSFIFIHACVGVFAKKKGGGTWGHGQEILFEMLSDIAQQPLAVHVSKVFIGLVGKHADRQMAKSMIDLEFGTGPLENKVSVVVESENIDESEFPTLNAAQEFSFSVHPHTKIAYMHTKGVRKNGIGNYPNEWRQYMQYFLIERFELCFAALDYYHYCTCGALKQGKIYAGNFWWTKAGYLSSRLPLLSSFTWSSANRYLAEEYLLNNMSSPTSAICNHASSSSGSGSGSAHRLHYCTHHTHHNMQLCHSPREWYYRKEVNQLTHTTSSGSTSSPSSPFVLASNQAASIPSSSVVLLRSNPQCYYRHLTPRSQTKHNASSWCHHNGFPTIPSS